MKKRILFLIHELTVGGAEKVIVNIMNNIDRNKYIVYLCIFNNIGILKKELKKDIIVHDLNAVSIKKGILKLVFKIIELKPDIVFAGISHLNLALSIVIPIIKLKYKIRFIARETSISSIHNREENNSLLFNFIYKYFYINFDIIICQSIYMKKDLIKHFSIPKKKLVVINNPVDTKKILLLSKSNNKEFNPNQINLLAVGRLERVKGYHLLINAVSKLKNKFELTILGDGKEKENLYTLAKNLGVIDRIHFLGFKSNPYSYMAQADIFILTSLYEGFPNVVLEANMCGLPVVAFNSPGGVGEIIDEHVNGLLVEPNNIESLVKTLESFTIKDYNSEEIKKRITNHYEINSIILKYEELL